MADLSPAPGGTSPSRALFDSFFAAIPHSPTLERISREVYGDDYAPELEAFSFVTRGDLLAMARALEIGPGDRFLDLGCGRGGPCLWVSRETGSAATGVDFSWVGAAEGRRRAPEFGVADRAGFVASDAAALALADRSHDAGMSIEALQLMPDRVLVLREVARVLRPGAPFVFTACEWRSDASPVDPTPILRDHGPLLAEAGLVLESWEETPQAHHLERAWYACFLELREEVAAEVGDALAGVLAEEAVEGSKQLASMRHVRIRARRP